MNGRSFLIAIAMVMLAGVVVTARDGGSFDGSRPASQGAAPPPGHARGHRGPGEPRRIPLDRVESLLAKMKTAQPRAYDHLQRLRRDHPRAFMRAMVRIDRFHRRMADLPAEMQKTIAAQRENRVERFDLLMEYRRATDETVRAPLRQKISGLTSRLFDADQKLKEYKLEQLTKELEQLRAELKDRATRREELIAEAAEQFMATPPFNPGTAR